MFSCNYICKYTCESSLILKTGKYVHEIQMRKEAGIEKRMTQIHDLKLYVLQLNVKYLEMFRQMFVNVLVNEHNDYTIWHNQMYKMTDKCEKNL